MPGRNYHERLASKLLIALHSASLFDGLGKAGKTVRQVRPRCCGREIDLENTTVCLNNIWIGGEPFVLLEPYCPICGNKVSPEFCIIH